MSNIYNLEPPTKGKVCLTTTLGDIEVELWAKEAPNACRNFVQLCLEGFYTKTTFHRIVPKFMIQAGDETGTGRGGVSIYGSYFKDEFHSRLRFTHRGLVACANQNAADTNNSQFFITLDRCEDLDKRYTIFGKVAGDTIFNVVRIAEIQTDGNCRPLETVGITACDVLWNPFDDIIPREVPKQIEVRILHGSVSIRKWQTQAETSREKKKGVKDLNLLSFGEDEEVEEIEVPTKRKMKSAHDVLQDDRLIAEDEEMKKGREEGEKKRRQQRVIDVCQALSSKKKVESTPQPKPSMDERLKARLLADSHDQDVPSKIDEPADVTAKEVSEPREKMGYERLYIKRKQTHIDDEDALVMDEAEATRNRLKQRKRLYGNREKETLDRLTKFQAGLKSKVQLQPHQEPKPETSVNVELPAAWRVGDYLKDIERIGVTDLISHRLEFDHAKKDAMSRDMHALDDYIVVDTRLEKGNTDVEEKWIGRPNV